MIEITQLNEKNFEHRCSFKLGKEYGDVLNNITEILNSKFTEGSEIFLEQSLKRLQEYHPVSIEFIRYCLLTENFGTDRDGINFLYTNFGKSRVKKDMRKLYRFLKKKNITIETKLGYYKRLLLWSNNLKKYLCCKNVHFFKV